MIIGLGLPRSAGQTLQNAISLVTGKNVWHSITADRWDSSITESDAGMVECYAPIPWLEETFSDNVYILNYREADDWMRSCSKVYQKSQDLNWNHPIWKYPLSQFLEYRNDYEERVLYHLKQRKLRYLAWDLTEYPGWKTLCSFLGVPEPDAPFPNVDKAWRGPGGLSGIPGQQYAQDAVWPDTFPSPW